LLHSTGSPVPEPKAAWQSCLGSPVLTTLESYPGSHILAVLADLF
jgi:hypothetical protein